MDSRKVTLLDLPDLRRRRARLVVIDAHMRKKGRGVFQLLSNRMGYSLIRLVIRNPLLVFGHAFGEFF
jgi:hypothetical protein